MENLFAKQQAAALKLSDLFSKFAKQQAAADKLLAEAVQTSVSFSEVLRKLAVKAGGGNQASLKKLIKEQSLDTSHFLGQRANCGDNHKGGVKNHWKEILVLRNDNRREKAVRLRRALIESGREYKCEHPSCTLREIWLEKPLVLQVNHKNGVTTDNRTENLEFLCPNCHSQTDNWGNSKGGTTKTSSAEYYREYRQRKKPRW